jgi:hypothetical protein
MVLYTFLVHGFDVIYSIVMDITPVIAILHNAAARPRYGLEHGCLYVACVRCVVDSPHCMTVERNDVSAIGSYDS